MQNFPTSLQDLCNMLPFDNGNLDWYFVCSFFFSFAELLQIVINYFYFKQNGIKKKMPLKAQKKPFQAQT